VSSAAPGGARASDGRMSELRVIGAITVLLAAWAVYTVAAIPVATRALDVLEPDAHSASVPSVDSKGRPALRACYRISGTSNAWIDDEDCKPWGGYDSVFRELCEQDSRCFERSMRTQQLCLDRPSSCYRFLSPRPALG
jgi:hypothetical protein